MGLALDPVEFRRHTSNSTMDALNKFQHRGIDTVFVDIDGTLTQSGRLPANVYATLWRLNDSGIAIVPVTGRPAGWCDLIARFWPVHGVIGENGALYYRLTNGKMLRKEWMPAIERKAGRRNLKSVLSDVRNELPHLRVAADQFSRRFDLAIDFAEDVGPFPLSDADRVRQIFESHGAHAKISNIHVNGWFGDFDKLKMCHRYCSEQMGFELTSHLDRAVFVGDSANDEPMFSFFKWSFAVANIREFLPRMKHHPRFVSNLAEGDGFCEIAERLLEK